MKIGQTSLAKFALKVAPSTKAVAGKSGASPVNIGSLNGWLTRGSENIAAQVETVKMDAQRKFAPEVMIKDGESKRLRFRANDAIGSLRQYSVKVNGRWQSVTQPPDGQPDPLRESGLRAGLKTLWEVIDIDGYTDKKGVEKKMLARFLKANVRLHDQLEIIKKKVGNLTTFNIEISRSGGGTNTTYTLLPESPSALAGAASVPSIKNDVSKYYAPVSSAELQSLADRSEPSED